MLPAWSDPEFDLENGVLCLGADDGVVGLGPEIVVPVPGTDVPTVATAVAVGPFGSVEVVELVTNFGLAYNADSAGAN